MDLSAPDELGATFEDVGKTKRRHEQRDRWLVDEGSEDGTLNCDTQQRHDPKCDRKSHRIRDTLFREPDKRKGSKK